MLKGDNIIVQAKYVRIDKTEPTQSPRLGRETKRRKLGKNQPLCRLHGVDRVISNALLSTRIFTNDERGRSAACPTRSNRRGFPWHHCQRPTVRQSN